MHPDKKKLSFTLVIEQARKREEKKLFLLSVAYLTRNRPINHAIFIYVSFSFPEGKYIFYPLGDAKYWVAINHQWRAETKLFRGWKMTGGLFSAISTK